MNHDAPRSWWRTPTGITVIGFALVLAFYILREHYAHAFGLLPYLIILACPLMHLFMHRGHGGHSHGTHKGQHDDGGSGTQR
ncbi:DUF2933 domain-containing protein [Falsiroseomonas sp. E2-1-a4]|uniref:DUF2933 domain-containing protein n=1 Tax=Falsiroseomonas sp. E2-1-a4 TaxID=3239299 RepID=UPI003F35A386